MKKPKEYFIRPGDGFKQRDLIMLKRAEPDDIHVVPMDRVKKIIEVLRQFSECGCDREDIMKDALDSFDND